MRMHVCVRMVTVDSCTHLRTKTVFNDSRLHARLLHPVAPAIVHERGEQRLREQEGVT